MRKLILVCAMSLLMALNACSAGSSSSSMQTVLAQSGYSNASLSGTYSLTWWNFYAANNGPSYYSAAGTIVLNGTGNITGGTITEYNPGSPYPCVYSMTGTYSLQSTALGTATVNLSSSTKGCNATDTWQVALAAGGSGTAIQMARTDQIANGSAVKQ